MSKTRILIHIVFVTKYRYQTIPLLKRPKLYSYLNGILGNYESDLLAINGMADHVHLLINLRPKYALSEIIQQLKGSSSKWMRSDHDFIKFTGWGQGYFAVSVSPTMIDSCKNYIFNQEIHHGGKGLLEEIKYLSERSGLQWYEDDWA